MSSDDFPFPVDYLEAQIPGFANLAESEQRNVLGLLKKDLDRQRHAQRVEANLAIDALLAEVLEAKGKTQARAWAHATHVSRLSGWWDETDQARFQPHVDSLMEKVLAVRPHDFISKTKLSDPLLVEPLRQAGLKIWRAQQHLDTLDDHCRANDGLRSARLRREPDDIDAEGNFKYRVEIDPVPEEVALIVGDITTNLAAALDYIAKGLASPLARKAGKRVYFPILDNPNTSIPGQPQLTTGAVERLGDPTVRAQVLLESIQPYEPGSPHHRDHLLPLRWLKPIVNPDKHSQLTPMRSAALGAMSWPSPDGGMKAYFGGQLADGDSLMLSDVPIDEDGYAALLVPTDLVLAEIDFVGGFAIDTSQGRWPVETTAEIVLMKLVKQVEDVWTLFCGDQKEFRV